MRFSSARNAASTLARPSRILGDDPDSLAVKPSRLYGRWKTFETHIRDVAGCIEAEEISNIILVGHSYGGMVITGLADRMADRIKAPVYLDAFVPGDGESLIALLSLRLLT